MPLGSAEIEQIGTYVRANLAEWMEDIVGPQLVGRTARVEDELAFQRELICTRFEAVDKRFEDLHRSMDKHFEAVDTRFEAMQRNMENALRGPASQHGQTFRGGGQAVRRHAQAVQCGCNGWWAAGWCCSPP